MSSRARARLFNTQSGSSSLLSGSITASRTSGIAPLGVMFDGVGGIASADPSISSLTNGGVFGQVACTYDFGHPAAGNWSRTGLSRNAQVCAGGITGHVFDAPGTYTVRPTLSSAGTGNFSCSPIVITVLDPNSIYTGTNTVVVGVANGSGRNDPSGCAYSLGAPTLASNKRYLFAMNSGSFSIGAPDGLTGVRIDVIDSSGVIGAGASGTLPRINATWQVGLGGAFSDIAVANVLINGLCQVYAGNHFTLWNSQIRNSNNDAMLGGSDYFDQVSNVIFGEVECHGEDATSGGGNGNYGFVGTLPRSAFLGVYVPTAYLHDIRLSHGWKTAVQHCQLPGNSGSGGKHSLKLNGGGGNAGSQWDGSTVDHSTVAGAQNGQDRWATQYVSVADNILGSATQQNDWTSECACQENSGAHIEAVIDVVYERNIFYRGSSGTPVECASGGRRHTFFKTGPRANTAANFSNGSINFQTSTNANGIPSGFDGPYFSP